MLQPIPVRLVPCGNSWPAFTQRQSLRGNKRIEQATPARKRQFDAKFRTIQRMGKRRNDYRLNSLVSSPIPSIATVTLLIGSFIDPTPSDVPQQIRSPGNNVMSCEILLTSCCALKIMSEIGYDWRSSPFSMVRTTSLAGSIPDAMTGPNGQKSSKPLARAHCANVASLLMMSAAVMSLTQV